MAEPAAHDDLADAAAADSAPEDPESNPVSMDQQQPEDEDSTSSAPEQPEEVTVREPLVKQEPKHTPRSTIAPNAVDIDRLDIEQPSNYTNVFLTVVILGAVLWYALGIVFFCLYEELSFIDGWYFITVTVTTVGYGVIVPQSHFSRAMAGVYVLVGVFFIAYAIAHMTAVILHRLESMVISNAIGGQSSSFWEMYGKRALWTSMLMLMLILTGTIIGGAYYDFNYADAFYWSVITLSTVGYGDFVPSNDGQRVVGGLFVIFGTTAFAMCVSQLMALVIANLKKSQVVKLMTPPLTTDALHQLDSDGSGRITEMAYLKFMLVSGGFVDARVINNIQASFKVLDKDGSGVLDESDLKAIVDDEDALSQSQVGLSDKGKEVDEEVTQAFGHIYHQGMVGS